MVATSQLLYFTAVVAAVGCSFCSDIMPTNWDEKWESLEWKDIEDMGGFEHLVKEKEEKNLAPLFSCVCMHNLQAHDNGESTYCCKNNLKTLGYFADLPKAKHRVKIHAVTCPRHPVSEEQAEDMLDGLPHSIKYCFLHEDEINDWKEEEERKKEEAKAKQREKKKRWHDQQEQNDRRTKKRARSYSREPARSSRGSPAPRARSPAPRDRLRSPPRRRRSPPRDRRRSPPRDRRHSPETDDEGQQPAEPINIASTAASQQMQQLILPSENFRRQSPKSILLEWLSKSQSAMENARRVAEFCANAYAAEAQKLEQASPD